MSREIDLSDPSALTEDEILYLHARGKLPAGVEVPAAPNAPSGSVPHLSAISDEDLIAELERRGYFDNDGEENEYSSMSKADLISLAEDRGIDSSGTKAEIIERLSA